jgi:hypothetical protein
MKSKSHLLLVFSACVALAALLVVVILPRIRRNAVNRPEKRQVREAISTDTRPKRAASEDGTRSISPEPRSQWGANLTWRDRRLEELEKAGKVPSNASPEDWQLAQKTTWWGKPVDPARFWTNRTAWLGPRVMQDANAYGRTYPPIPTTADTSWIPHFDQEQDCSGIGSVDDAGPRFWSNARESAFWNRWILSHPRPPEDIARKQTEVAGSLFRARRDLADGRNLRKLTLDTLSEHERMMREEATGLGYPSEALSDDALLWSYVQTKRDEYQEWSADTTSATVRSGSNFFRRVYVDRKYITEPLSADDIQAANAWKVAYLRRLRQEKTDESYINAYLQAWNLSSNDVFGGGRRGQRLR